VASYPPNESGVSDRQQRVWGEAIDCETGCQAHVKCHSRLGFAPAANSSLCRVR